MKNCRKYESKIRDYIYGELEVDDVNKTEKHLEECLECREFYESELRVKNMLNDFSTVEKSAFTSSRGEIMSRIDKNRYGKSFWKRLLFGIRGGIWGQVASALMIVLVVSSGVILVRNRNMSVRGNVEVNPGIEASGDMNKVISDYLLGKDKEGFFSTDAWFESHQILGKEEVGDSTRIYLYKMFKGFDLDNKNFKEVAGENGPAVIDLKKDSNGKYSVVNYKRPGDGSQYIKDIKAMFPSVLVDKALNDTGIKLALDNDINRQALEWLKAQRKETVTIDCNYYYFEIPENIKIYKLGREYTIKKGSPLFNEILYLTKLRFGFNDGNSKVSKSMETTKIVVENTEGFNYIVMSFEYNQKAETSYSFKTWNGEVYKAEYLELYMPLSGFFNDNLVFRNGENDDSVSLEGLSYSKELIDLINGSLIESEMRGKSLSDKKLLTGDFKEIDNIEVITENSSLKYAVYTEEDFLKSFYESIINTKSEVSKKPGDKQLQREKSKFYVIIYYLNGDIEAIRSNETGDFIYKITDNEGNWVGGPNTDLIKLLK